MPAQATEAPRRHYSRTSPAGPGDGIPLTMCRNCGLTGHHANHSECIDALRSALAVAQFRAKVGRPSSARAIDSGRV